MDKNGKVTPFGMSGIILPDETGWIAGRPKRNRKLFGPNGQIIPRTDSAEIVNVLTENRAPVTLVKEKKATVPTSEYIFQSPQYSYCTETGELLASRFDQVSKFNQGVAAVRTGKSVGFIGLDGQFLKDSKMVDCQFKDEVSEGCLPVFADGFWGYLDTQGNWLVKPQFDSAEPFSGGFALVRPHESDGSSKSPNNLSYIDKTGKLFEKRFHSGEPFEGGYAAVSVMPERKDAERLWGLIDQTGQWAVKPQSGWISPLVGSSRLLKEQKLVGIFTDGKTVMPPKYLHIGKFSEGLASFQDPITKQFGFLDKSGHIIIPAHFAYAGVFSEGLAAVRVFNDKNTYKSKIGFIDHHGEMIIAPQFAESESEVPDFNDSIVQFHESFCVIQGRPYHSGKYIRLGSGLINKSGQWVENKVLTFAYPFRGGRALVKYYPDSERKRELLVKKSTTKRKS